MLVRLQANWDAIKLNLIREIDRDYHIYIPSSQRQEELSFNADRFAQWLTNNNIPWTRLESGRSALR